TQFKISSIQFSGMVRFLDKVFLKYLYKIKKDHTHKRGEGQIPAKTDMQKPVSSPDSLKGESRGAKSSSKEEDSGVIRERIAVELLTVIKLPAYLNFINKNNYMHFISHPKMLNQHNH